MGPTTCPSGSLWTAVWPPWSLTGTPAPDTSSLTTAGERSDPVTLAELWGPSMDVLNPVVSPQLPGGCQGVWLWVPLHLSPSAEHQAAAEARCLPVLL
ncbi:UNVERIFIED_CONTAM: hypothetical protein FKN15_020963 [Acipenser sinensis]